MTSRRSCIAWWIAVTLSATACPPGGPPPQASPPVPRFAFLRDGGQRALAAYAIEPDDRLRPLYSEWFERGLGKVAVLPSQLGLVVGSGPGELSTYRLDLASGAIARRDTKPFGDLTDFAVDPSGGFVLAPDYNRNSVHLVGIDNTTLAMHEVSETPWTGFRPTNVEIEPQGRWAYIYSTAEARLQGARIDRSPAVALVPVGMSDRVSSLKGVFVDRDSRFAYAVGLGPAPGTSTVFPFRIAADGSITSTGASTSVAQIDLTLRFWPKGRWVFGVGGGDMRLFEIQSSGALQERTFVLGNGALDVAMDGERNVLFITGKEGRRTSRFDPATGAVSFNNNLDEVRSTIWSADAIVTAAGRDRVKWWPRWLAIAGFSDDVLSVAAVDPATGALTFAGSVKTGGVGPAGLALHPKLPVVYVANATSDQVTALALDAVNGKPSPIGGPVTVGRFPGSLAVETSGRFLYVMNRLANSISILALDPVTGQPSPSGIPNLTTTLARGDSLAASGDGRAIYVLAGQPPAAQRYRVVITGTGFPGPLGTAGNLVPEGAIITMSSAFASLNASIVSDGRGSEMFAVFPERDAFYSIDELDGGAVQATNNLAHLRVVARAPDQQSLIAAGSSPGALERFQGLQSVLPVFPNGAGVVPFSDPTIDPLCAVIDPSSRWLYVGDGGNHKIFGFRLNGAAGNPVELTPVWGSPRRPSAMVLTRSAL